MKTIRLTLVFFALTALGGLACAAERANERGAERRAEHASVRGILITASNEPGQIDRRLAAYEPTLRRILRFESYRWLGEDSFTLAVPDKGQLSLGEGHRLELETEGSDDHGIHVRVRWLAGGRTLMNTGLVLRPGVPAVLGGPSTGGKGEVYAVILVGR